MGKTRRINKPTRLLSAEDNEAAFDLLLRPKCTSTVTTVAKLYYPEFIKWAFQASGILCYERDGRLKGHYLRFYGMQRQRKVFDLRINRDVGLTVLNDNNFFQLIFDGRTAGFGFVDTKEARQEVKEITDAMKARIARSKMTTFEVVKEKIKIATSPKEASPRSETSDEKELKITTKDISGPTDFRHVQHLGSDANGIQKMVWATDPIVKLLFSVMGKEYEEILRTERGQKALTNVINDQGGIEKFREAAKMEIASTQSSRQPPPVCVGSSSLRSNTPQATSVTSSPSTPPPRTQSQPPPTPPKTPASPQQSRGPPPLPPILASTTVSRIPLPPPIPALPTVSRMPPPPPIPASLTDSTIAPAPQIPTLPYPVEGQAPKIVNVPPPAENSILDEVCNFNKSRLKSAATPRGATQSPVAETLAPIDIGSSPDQPSATKPQQAAADSAFVSHLKESLVNIQQANSGTDNSSDDSGSENDDDWDK